MAHSHRNTNAHREVRDAARSAPKRQPQSRHCGTKRSYRNRAAAYGDLAKLHRRLGPGVRLEVYHCRFCGQYHAARRQLRPAVSAEASCAPSPTKGA